MSAFTCCYSFEPSYSVLYMRSSRQDFCFFCHMTSLFSLQLWRSKSFICSCMFSDEKKNQWEKISISDSHTSCVCGKRAHVNILVMSNINNETSHFKTGLSLKRSSFIVLLWLIILRAFLLQKKTSLFHCKHQNQCVCLCISDTQQHPSLFICQHGSF